LYQSEDGALWAGTVNRGVFLMDLTTSNREIDWGPSFELFPNPATDYLSLKMDEPVSGIQIINSMGVETLSKDIYGETSPHFSVSEIPNGLYHLIVEYSGGKKAIDKFIKIK
jgi:hypothetical protein